MRSLKYKTLWLVIGYAMVLFVVYSSLTSSPMGSGIYVSDKFLHTVGYFGLMGWFVQLYQERKAQLYLAVIFISMGVLLEFLQDLGGVRYFEFNDMLANAAGVLLAFMLVKTPFPNILYQLEKKFNRIDD